MMRELFRKVGASHTRALGFGVLAALGLAGCSRPFFALPAPMAEQISPNIPIPPGGYRTIATVAGGARRTDLRISGTVRLQLEDSGFTVVRRAGRWDDEREAVRAICAPNVVPVVDGVLFVWYNRLELRDCATEGTAFEIKASANRGINDMTSRLVAYLRSGPSGAGGQQAPPQ
jgi:hypothetical protein